MESLKGCRFIQDSHSNGKWYTGCGWEVRMPTTEGDAYRFCPYCGLPIEKAKLPYPLQTEGQFRRAMARLEEIFPSARRGTPEGEEFSTLAIQVYEWEKTHMAIESHPGSPEARENGCMCSPENMGRVEAVGRFQMGWLVAEGCPTHDHPPGTLRARLAGCRCPAMDNADPIEGRVSNGLCPLHWRG